MSQQYPGTWKQCATCAFWMGQRDCDRFGQRVTVSSPMDKGRCACQHCGWRNMEKQANSQCQSWQKWPVLK